MNKLSPLDFFKFEFRNLDEPNEAFSKNCVSERAWVNYAPDLV